VSKLLKVVKYLNQLYPFLVLVTKALDIHHAPVGTEVPFSDVKFKIKGNVYEVRGAIIKIGGNN